MNYETLLSKYIFVDVVSFTKGRSVEAQADIIYSLNNIVKESLKNSAIRNEDIILIPTGDGICLALLNNNIYDIHLKISCDVLNKLYEYNQQVNIDSRKYQIRIGINENVDNIIVDINGNKNVAGSGINQAQRIMNVADGNQILIGQSVYEILSSRESYLNKFVNYQTTDKHGNQLIIYQFIAKDIKGLNTDTPTIFKTYKSPDKRLTKLVAYYIANLIKIFEVYKESVQDNEYCVVVVAYLKSIDLINQEESVSYDKPTTKCYNSNTGNLKEEMEYYKKIDLWVMIELANFIEDKYLTDFSKCFGERGFMPDYFYVNKHGIDKLKNDFPLIWKQFEFDKLKQA
jgi:hypothetical protein